MGALATYMGRIWAVVVDYGYGYACSYEYDMPLTVASDDYSIIAVVLWLWRSANMISRYGSIVLRPELFCTRSSYPYSMQAYLLFHSSDRLSSQKLNREKQ